MYRDIVDEKFDEIIKKIEEMHKILIKEIDEKLIKLEKKILNQFPQD